MGNRFVGMQRGERDIHWVKLGGFAVLTFVAVAATFEFIWFRLAGHWSGAALLVAAFVSTLVVIRSALRAYSIPVCELNPKPAAESPAPTSPEGVDVVEKAGQDSVVLPC